MPISRYTTSVPVSKTVAEIQAVLAKAGANAVATRFDAGKATGVSFTIIGTRGEEAYTLPVNVAGVHKVLQKQVSRNATEAQAERVAWRIVKDWLVAQTALVEAGQANLEQVMLPYMHVGALTVYERFLESGLKQLE